MPWSRRWTRKSPKPQPTSRIVRPWKSPSASNASKRSSCEVRVRKPRPRWSKPCRATLSAYQRVVSISGSDAFIAGLADAVEDLAGLGAHVEQQVERGEARNEGAAVALGVDRVLEALPLHADARARECFL